ncbi:alpha/beta hydrolase [Segniliparus rotundus]|uniref:alpha/beta hydrolase n=1 Tax=Segniliparus rotundus TaxID=286802 RepID=UPI0002DFA80C|nr:alpha/beta hydrolase-fold protein [Segniliparus rotundus]
MAVRLGRVCGALVVLSALFLNSAPAWSDPDPDLTDPIPGAIEEKDVAALQGTPQPSGSLVRVNVPDTVSHFPRRPEYVYLPPAWFASKTPPHLPAVMMIAGQGDSPEYWARNGAAVQIASDFAANHGGNSPILAFVDFGGFFNADTECVNGPRGNVEDHLTKEVPQYVNAKFATTNWGVVGWSMGGTCAVTLAATHPDLFSGFVDVVGYERPSLPDGEDTLGALFGGNKAAQDAHDTLAVIAQHRYTRTAGWFQVTGHPGRDNETKENSDADVWVDPDSTNAAKALCEAGRKSGMSCAVYVGPGRHLWPFARSTFSDSLPWLAGYLHTPGVPEIGLAPSDL